MPALPEPAGRALVRRPGPAVADGLLTHLKRTPVDAARALEQWTGYVAAFTAAGWDVVEVPEAPEHPDAVFVEDTAVVVGEVAIACRPGAPSREGEVAGTVATLTGLGYPVLRMREGHLDGGDVLQVGMRIYVGTGGRTDAAGAAEFARLIEPLGRTVRPVPHGAALHLKSAVTALPDGTVLGHPALAGDPPAFPGARPVPEQSGSHVVDLGGGRVLLAASAPRTAVLLADLGWTPVPVDIEEFERLEGCVTCLSVRLRRPPQTVPAPPPAPGGPGRAEVGT
ncbi:dimethylargininase [Nakamurella endophytica]|uniref:N(G),N(G)-dimethylarginine dimethylaminohydrolase n=1 Tax=Nakamurella endophytica TaxID=1748367 RepID=A0A917T1Y5_9ACTN|nr:dimethylargininase [Nakamurella endophytica]GGM07685.1 N(G),N(G)-dimethylarginine dimethylaminohydrolase [Nakamurella endophytica]